MVCAPPSGAQVQVVPMQMRLFEPHERPEQAVSAQSMSPLQLSSMLLVHDSAPVLTTPPRTHWQLRWKQVTPLAPHERPLQSVSAQSVWESQSLSRLSEQRSLVGNTCIRHAP
jgi:hypothetical protein